MLTSVILKCLKEKEVASVRKRNDISVLCTTVFTLNWFVTAKLFSELNCELFIYSKQTLNAEASNHS